MKLSLADLNLAQKIVLLVTVLAVIITLLISPEREDHGWHGAWEVDTARIARLILAECFIGILIAGVIGLVRGKRAKCRQARAQGLGDDESSDIGSENE